MTEKELAPPGLARRAYDGARHTVLYGFGAGAIIGLLSEVPVLMCAGAGAIVAMAAGAIFTLARR
ncbi:MAG TPA: hypothetical protein VIU61_03895 [Kofleriaceae bacterium]